MPKMSAVLRRAYEMLDSGREGFTCIAVKIAARELGGTEGFSCFEEEAIEVGFYLDVFVPRGKAQVDRCDELQDRFDRVLFGEPRHLARLQALSCAISYYETRGD